VAPSHRRPLPVDRFWFGAPHYPEHSTPEERKSDAHRMREAGFNVVRMAEFAWDLLEPEPGTFMPDLFDEVIDDLHENGVATILCTPTATPPRWLTRSNPDVLRIHEDGRRAQHGARQHCCTTSPILRDAGDAITRRMAEHWAGHPAVVGWQTDNELNTEQWRQCHCEACQTGFRAYLADRYGDVSSLNDAWGTQFWSQTYDDFDQIETPKRDRPASTNPSHVLDYRRFLAAATAEFQRRQVAVLRAADPERRWFVFHNAGVVEHLDIRGAFGEPLDFLGYDVYPMFVDPPQRPWYNAWALDWIRAWAGNVFVPEHQSGPCGQVSFFSENPEPGEIRRMSWTTIGHGADSLMYFRWRTARFGAEEYWCGVLDHDNVPRRRFREVADMGAELGRIGGDIVGTTVHVDAAVAGGDLLNLDAHASLPLGLPGPLESARRVHAAMHRAGLAVGVVHPEDDLEGVALYVVPHWPVFLPTWAARLGDWVGGGGTLVVGSRTGTRDENNHVVTQAPPGVLGPLCGVTVEEYGAQRAPDRERFIVLGDQRIKTSDWYEVLRPTEVVATWHGRHLTGAPAVTRRSVGAGAVVYVGTQLTGRLVGPLLPFLTELSGLRPLWPGTALPDGVACVRRDGAAHSLWIVTNGSDEAVDLDGAPDGDVLAGDPRRLQPNDVLILRTARAL
jgi:beta-galactosidase